MCYRIAEEAKTTLVDINIYQGWTAEPQDNNNTQSNKHKEKEIEEKGQLPITRNESNIRKDINENRENTKTRSTKE